MKTGIANLPLHYGKAPRWLFEYMTRLARDITIAIVDEFGPVDFLEKISSPFWFQSLGSLLGFDWHSSGVTTTVCGAIKEGIKDIEGELGIFVAGGKGRTGRKTPDQIAEKEKFIGAQYVELLKYASRMSAKVDSAGIQDGYQIYHHTIFFTKKGEWGVVQQGMNPENRMARRYHWFSTNLISPNFVDAPHQGIISARIENNVLDTVAKGHNENRSIAASLSKAKPDETIKELEKLQTLTMPSRHQILIADIDPKKLYKVLIKTYEQAPSDFEKLLSLRGVGAKTIRALSLMGELIYGAPISFKDPARFGYAHGGKDGIPYPVDKKNYEKTITVLEKAISSAKIGQKDKLRALYKLQAIYS